MDLFATKSVDHLIATSQTGHALRRVLGPWHLIALGIGAIIGTGIFVLSGQAAAANAGPAIVMSMACSRCAGASRTGPGRSARRGCRSCRSPRRWSRSA